MTAKLSYIDQEDGPTITIREDETGRWAAAMTDRWQVVDDTLDALLQNVEDGNMTCRQRDDGEFLFKMTEKGNVAADDKIGSDPEMASLYAQMMQSHGQKPALTPVAERVLVSLAAEESHDIASLIEATGFTEGQVIGALELLTEVGLIESEQEDDA